MGQQETTLRWQYSRSQLRHWVTDGELYRDGKPHPDGYELFEIRTNRKEYAYRKPTDQFRLIHKGKIVDMHRMVKVLKATADSITKK